MISEILHEDCLDVLSKIEENSLHFCVTDPPYGLGGVPDILEVLSFWTRGKPWKSTGKGFMGHEWDAFVPGPEIWRELHRTLVPGAYAAVFAGSRTQDLMMLSLRLAGFHVRDCYQWFYSSGMPKSRSVWMDIEKLMGATPQQIGTRVLTGNAAQTTKEKGGTYASNTNSRSVPKKTVPVLYPTSPEALRWYGYGTNVKPAYEPIIIVQKPISEKTLAQNVMKWGAGLINIQAAMVPRSEFDPSWPANVILSKRGAEILDVHAGNRPGMSGGGKHKHREQTIAGGGHDGHEGHIRPDSGGPSRFFHYAPKASRRERDLGLGAFPELAAEEAVKRDSDSIGAANGRAGAGRTGGGRNPHPTVKPHSLISWLMRLLYPGEGVGIDPFVGSGTSSMAAVWLGIDFFGIEKEEPYVRVAEARRDFAINNKKPDWLK